MKILLVGSQKEWAIENHYKRYLAERGAEVELFPIHDLFYDFYYKSLFNKVTYKLFPTYVFKDLNRQLIKLISSSDFEVIWIFKGMEIFPETLKTIKRTTKSKLVNYNPDHPFQFSGKGSGNSNVLESIGLYDLHFCYHPDVLQKIEQEYKVPCTYLPFGYEPAEVNLPGEEEEILKACFIGNPDKKRAQYLQYLIDRGVPLDVYGNGWSNVIRPNKNTCMFSAIYGEELNRIAPRYRVQINIFRAHNEGAHNMRTFEMPGMGCCVVAPKSPDHRQFFKEGGEILLYRDLDDLLSKIHELLSWSFKNANNMRNAALKRSNQAGYDYASKSKMALSFFESLVCEK
jgi:spore maturation protein CgeB